MSNEEINIPQEESPVTTIEETPTTPVEESSPVSAEETTDTTQTSETKIVDAVIKQVPPVIKPAYPVREDYYKRYYLRYGYTEEETPELANLRMNDLKDFLCGIGYKDNFLTKAREEKETAERIEKNYQDSKRGTQFCDFCGVELIGTEFDILKDGRERCPQCTRTAIRSEKVFQQLYQEAILNLQLFFGITIATGVKIHMVNSQTLHRKLKKAFIPTAGYDPRILGVAIKENKEYSILMENGCPRLAAIETLVHELTHIWQYQNWDEKEILRLYGKKQNIEIYEGMAKWVEIQYMFLLGEAAIAKRMVLETANRNDEYGRGFLKYVSVYPLSFGTTLEGATPFDDIHRPL